MDFLQEVNGQIDTWPSSFSSPPLLFSPVIGLGKSCRHAGLQFPHGSRWEEECNACQCVNGYVRCSKVSLAGKTLPKCSRRNKNPVTHRLLRLPPGEVRPSALPPPQSSASSCRLEPSALPRRSRVCGASVPHLLLTALPPVGCVFDARPPDAPAHPVWAQQWLPWQQLRSHHAHLQEGQSAAGEWRQSVNFLHHDQCMSGVLLSF